MASQTYTVKSGDSLSAIAARYGVSMSNVTGYRSGNPNLIYPGEVLTINIPSAQPSGPVGNDASQTYTYNQTSYAYGTGPYASQFPKKTITQPTNNQPSGPVGNDASQTYIYNNTSYAYGTGPYASQFPKKTTSSGNNNNNNNNNQQQQPQQQQPQQEPTQTWYVLSSSGALYFSITGTQAQAQQAAQAKGLSGFQISASLPTNNNNNNNQNQNNNTNTNTTTQPNDLTWLKNDPNYMKLPKDMQDYLVTYYGILKVNDQESQKKLLDALGTAQGQANAYWGEVINVAKDSLTRTLSGYESDFSTQEKNLTDNIARLKTDLATKKGDMSIDEQAELARQLTRYKNDLSSLRQNSATTGLTFSSKRALAESQLSASNTDIVESTKRNYMREGRDLELAASRGESDALAKIADYKRILGEQEMKSIRDVEAQIGTGNLPNLAGLLTTNAGPAGNVNGTIVDQKTKDIFQRASALASLGNPFLN